METINKIPVIPIRDLVVFPSIVIPLVVGRPGSVEALNFAEKNEGFVFLVAQKNSRQENITKKDVYRTGTVARILQIIRLPNNYQKAVVESIARARILKFLTTRKLMQAQVELIQEDDDDIGRDNQELNHLILYFRQYVKGHPELPDELAFHLDEYDDPGKIADFIALNIEIEISEKQKILEETSLYQRIQMTTHILKHLVGYQQFQQQLDNEVRDNIMGIQREHYLQEQLRVIKKELGDEDQIYSDIQKIEKAVVAAKMPKHALDRATEEIEKLKKTPPFSPEYTVTRNYLDWMIHVPWSKRSRDRIDVMEAQRILDKDHYGLEKPKERIIEHLAVLQRVKKIKGPILCLVGPPGVGKTSLGRSVARALNRKFIRVSLGGVRDEAEIRGHRRTYIGAMPGKIIQSMKKAGTKNPVFLLDEVDKMSMDFRGDPSSALLEVLDPEQNYTFNDHYLDLDYDLSEIFFITTANVQANVPLPLQDRMEIIELPGYLEHEKMQIARQFLIPKQLKEHGLTERHLRMTDDALLRIIREYTREAGVRNLEREIAKICRKSTRRLIEQPQKKQIKVSGKNIEQFLGKPLYLMRENQLTDLTGEAIGLAWTPYGGDILKIEVNSFPGEGKLTLTGKLGDVMKESAQAALSYIRSIAKEIQMKPELFKKRDIHIHVPEGAIPKDGPSAGITLATAMISALSGRKVLGSIAMTGEITLRGKVLAVGGLNEKMLAAQRNNVPTVIVPAENEKEIADLPPELRQGITIIPVKEYREVYRQVFR